MVDLPKPMLPSVGTNPITFLREVKSELLRVTWPKREEVVKLTFIVIAVSIALGLYVGGLDLVLTKLTDLLIAR